ncbi:alpha/beta hydrolase [Amorphus orientalis]|uniref:Pimeloyl-ACP methyl ester carboxylesterase n=1 Tax=Amorphus orientalis TaxID=649198 RepID=A0AAE4ASQ8_9HYPH|nr:alpha/beta fold hydrolase [Amorphus orientalis]MDQ0314219.1 pimeloyl-ACP methyl ester carboxylesterase [Amorphus orientalis]
MATYVLVHGAWHTGELFEETAAPIRAAGHVVHLPTIAGNRPGDAKSVGLDAAISSIVDYLTEHDLSDVILAGHSYGGMVITGVADRVPDRLRRLVYWNAFVPNDGESLNDLVPPHYVTLFDGIAAASPDNGVMLPFPIWREVFINDADLELAQSTYEKLNPHPYATFTDKISLKTNPAAMQVAKSYVNCTEDTALPQSLGWHPRMSEKLGLFRLVQSPGSHELCFTNPGLLAEKIMIAGRD